MNILTFFEQRRKQKATQAGEIVAESGNIAIHGLALSISDAIQNSDTIKSRRLVNSALNKLSNAATRVLRNDNQESQQLDEEEAGILEIIGKALKDGVVTLVSGAAKGLLKMVALAVEYTAIPIFSFFTSAATAAIGLLVENPYTALAAATVFAVGTASYKLYQYLKNKDAALPDNNVTANYRNTGTASSDEIASNLRDKDLARIQGWAAKLNFADKEKRHNLQPGLLSAVMAQESNGDPNARSSANAIGLFQLMPVAVAQLKSKGFKVDPRNPEQSAEGAAILLEDLLKSYHGDYDKALMAYNVGANALNQALRGERKLSKETIEYALRVKGQYRALYNKSFAEATNKGPVLPPSYFEGLKRGRKIEGAPDLILPTKGVLSSPFGNRFLGGAWAAHEGIDIANAEGTPIYAAAAGKVIQSSASNGYGSLIAIDHGNVITRYGHTRKQFVKPGDYVAQGAVIAEMGNEGRSTGPHLHFEVRDTNGKALNPADYLPNLPAEKGQAIQYQSPKLTEPLIINYNGQPVIIN
jgi:murein DD-endopeptidase MepM/ murein hydrolase activator NlpD